MRRKRCHRRIEFNPEVLYFKPVGVSLRELEEVTLRKDELEAIRLKDFEGLDQEKSAERMEISQPTLHRTLVSARKKIAEALINGKAIKIEK